MPKVSVRHTVARIISHGLDPSLMWPLFIFMVLLGSGLAREQIAILLIPVFFLEAVTPVGLVVLFKRMNIISDWEITNFKERRLLFSAVVVAHGISLVLFYFLGNELAFEIRLLAWLIQATGTLVTFYWKISVHTSSFTMVAFVLILLFGWMWWPVLLLIPPLAWSRVERKKHTWAQVIAGSGLTALVFYLGLTFLEVDLNTFYLFT